MGKWMATGYPPTSLWILAPCSSAQALGRQERAQRMHLALQHGLAKWAQGCWPVRTPASPGAFPPHQEPLLITSSLQIQPRVVAILGPCSSQSTMSLYPNTMGRERNEMEIKCHFPELLDTAANLYLVMTEGFSLFFHFSMKIKKKKMGIQFVFTKHLCVMVGHFQKVESLIN